MKPLHSLPLDAPVRRVAEWLYNERWKYDVSLIVVMVACENLGMPAGSASDIWNSMVDYGWLKYYDAEYLLNPEVFGHEKGMSECPHCKSKLWFSEHEDVRQRKERLDREDNLMHNRELRCAEDDITRLAHCEPDEIKINEPGE